MVKSWLKILFVFVGPILCLAEKAAAVPGDYDGDGKADLAIIDADQPEDKTTVFVRQSSNGTVVPNVFFPFGDFVISGNFFGGAKTYAGIVAKRTKVDQLQWRIKNPEGRETIFAFGKASTDVVPNQGDLDCDGKTDFLLVRNDPSGFKIWYALMSTAPTVVQQTLFGENGDKAFTADVNGDGCSEIVALRGNFNWFSRGFYAATFNTVQWGLPGDIPLMPVDLNYDGISDYVVSRPSSNGQTMHIRFGADSSMSLPVGPESSLPFTGDFFGDGKDVIGWFERSRGLFTLRQPNSTLLRVSFGNPRRGIVRPDGTVVTEEESGRFTALSSGDPSGSDDDGVQCDSQIRLTDGPGNFVYNPETSKGTGKVVLPSSYNEKVDNVSAYKDGEKIEVLRYAGLEVRNRRRWYFRKSPSSYSNNILVAVKMNAGDTRCVTIPDPKRRYD